MAAAAMNAVANEFAGRGVASVFVYTREAHPGEHYRHHDSFERKLDHARALRDGLEVTRPVLVDDLDGTCHRAYGLLPNMSWIVLRRGTIAYKADWTDAADVGRALVQILEDRQPRQTPLQPFYSERLAFRAVDREGFMRGLERNGPKAVSDFAGPSRAG